MLFSMPLVAYVALGSLEWDYPPLERRPPAAQAIVVFSAGMTFDATRGRPQLDEDTLLRCLFAADLYRQGPACPVVVSGGKVVLDEMGPAPAEVMAALLTQLGVTPTDLIIEANSRTTFENARESAKILDERSAGPVLLVVDAVDMRRASACLRKQGVEVIPAACHHRALGFGLSFFSFVPSPGAARNCQRVWHEWVGIAWYRLHGRI